MTNLLALSAELHELIYGDLDATDQLAFLSVCQTLYQSFRVSWTCDAVQQKLVKKRQVVAIWDDVQARVVGEEGKEKKIGKLRPMVVVGVRVEETDIILSVVLGRAALVRMTGSMLRRYWGRNCPECRGSRSICPGCGGVSVRWVECFASCGYSMPCPSCVGIGWAMRYKSAMRGDEEEYLEEIWTRVDEIDGVASNPM
ncbi:hypothetical protein B0H15DRAFT_621450 [Mycena belliarum]|uniref:F-box domain-containing protein n=1 Tax=Mycena belliarum TaxID=1033014 RepID=A0AAD6UDL4_9AGAR|nr:hypothetical protein B0H15DRAFT_621450 [Mycena belliae]